jgi:hypothetical protein
LWKHSVKQWNLTCQVSHVTLFGFTERSQEFNRKTSSNPILFSHKKLLIFKFVDGKHHMMEKHHWLKVTFFL